MEVKSIRIAIIILLLITLLAQISYAQSAPSDTAIMSQINDRLERNKAEIIKAVRDAQITSQNETNTGIDMNFKVLDDRIQQFLKNAKRDMAIVMVASFLVGFAISQIMRIAIERRQRKAQIQRLVELEATLERMTKDAQELTLRVKELKNLDQKYTADLKTMANKPRFFTIQMAIFGIITFLVGILITKVFLNG